MRDSHGGAAVSGVAEVTRLLHTLHNQIVTLRRLLTYAIIRTGAFGVILFFPPERWYRLAFLLSHAIAGLSSKLRPHVHDPSLEARLLGRYLDALSVPAKMFPIPTRVEGCELFMEASRKPGGFVLCSAHLPLVKPIITRARHMLGEDYPMGVAAKTVREDGTIFIWGDRPIAGVLANGTMLIRTRTLLKKGGCLMLLVDKEQGEAIPTSIFRFVGKMNSRIIATFSYLQSDGTILVRFVEPPAPLCRDENEVHANLDFIARNVQEIMAGDIPPDNGKRTVTLWTPLPEQIRNRELERIHLYSCEQLATRITRLSAQLALKEPVEDEDGSTNHAMLLERLELMRSEQQRRCLSS
jgi:hypothetical protein